MTFYRAGELPDWEISSWLNTGEPLALAGLRGRVVAVYAFQMLCPGCLEFSLPQAQRVHEQYARDQVAVVGLHTVFESHTRMGDEALARFLKEKGYTFPVGVDAPGVLWAPRTMERWGLQGTPSLVLIDGAGRRRMQKLGHESDEALGTAVSQLLGERQGRHE
ncbi:MAG: TlpA family protein disulfide reductase [Acidobacteria bacterium]|nr:TlpA family protein disulfide reductase [Acidobacteriota bacterium]